MESSSKRLKQRLARLFRPSVLLRSPCNHSTGSSSIFSSTPAGSTTASRRSINSASISAVAVEPVFLPRNVVVADVPLFLRGATPGRHDVSGSCRPASRASSERNLDDNKKDSDTPTKDDSYYNNYKEEEEKYKKKKNVRRKKLLSNGYGFSSSSSSDDEGFELFSSSGEQCISEETETFFSSARSFSSDSSEFYTNSRKKKKNKNKNKNKKLSRCPPMRNRIIRSSNESEGSRRSAAAKRSGMIPVAKRSRDPYVDFRNSMVEMIAEGQSTSFGTEGLEELLRSYLSLNSAHHHPAILRAFADISQVLFCQ